MEISQVQLKAFRSLYQKHFGIELSKAETLEKALALLNLMRLVYRPITENDLDLIREKSSL